MIRRNVFFLFAAVLTLILLVSPPANAQDPFRLDQDDSSDTTNSSANSASQNDNAANQHSDDESDSNRGDETDDNAQDESEELQSSDSGDADGDVDADGSLESLVDDASETSKDAAEKLMSGDLSGAADLGGQLLSRYGFSAIIAIVIIVVAYFVASFLARICSLPIRRKVDETLGRFVAKLIFYSVMACAILGVLQYFGIGVTSFAAVIAAAGFAVGLAFQGTLSNFAAGIMLLVFRPFKVGDFVKAGGVSATIHEIDLFTTAFDTPDNRRIIVPNSEIIGGTIENVSHHSERRVDISVGVDYNASVAGTREVLAEAAESCHDLLLQGEGRGYQIVLGDLGDSAVGWTVRFWVKAADYWATKERLTEAVKNHLDGAGIGIPYPQMDVHLIQSSSGD